MLCQTGVLFWGLPGNLGPIVEHILSTYVCNIGWIELHYDTFLYLSSYWPHDFQHPSCLHNRVNRAHYNSFLDARFGHMIFSIHQSCPTDTGDISNSFVTVIACISPNVLRVLSQCTEHPLMYWAPTNVLQPHYTE